MDRMDRMDEKYIKLLTIENDRILIDVAYRGCGSGCKYCYVKFASDTQVLASYDELSKLVKFLKDHNRIAGHIISFCPNTEPFKSDESANRVIFLIKRLLRYPCYIQMSTKEYLKDSLLQELDSLAENNSNFFINISIPFLETKEIEPKAADLRCRIDNLARINHYRNLKGGLYLKPFSPNVIRDAEQYNEIIQKTRPDYMCVGMHFDKNANNPCTTLYRPGEASAVIAAQIQKLLEFREKIQLAPDRIVYSSVCAIARMTEYKCSLNLWNYSEDICKHCVRRNNGY